MKKYFHIFVLLSDLGFRVLRLKSQRTTYWTMAVFLTCVEQKLYISVPCVEMLALLHFKESYEKNYFVEIIGVLRFLFFQP